MGFQGLVWVFGYCGFRVRCLSFWALTFSGLIKLLRVLGQLQAPVLTSLAQRLARFWGTGVSC